MEFVVKLIHAFNPASDAFLFMWAILLVGLFSLTIILDRLWYLQTRAGFRTGLFMNDIISLINSDDMAGAIALCKKARKMALAQVVNYTLEHIAGGVLHAKNAVDEALMRVVPELEKRTGYLAVIGNVSTLLGLLGTVYGLIMSFAAVGRPGIDAAQKSELLAAGIATAMNSTFLGLSVAIASVMIYAVFKAKTQRIVDELDENSLRLVNLLTERSYKTQKFHVSSAQLKEGIGVHVTPAGVKIYADDKLVREINR